MFFFVSVKKVIESSVEPSTDWGADSGCLKCSYMLAVNSTCSNNMAVCYVRSNVLNAQLLMSTHSYSEVPQIYSVINLVQQFPFQHLYMYAASIFFSLSMLVSVRKTTLSLKRWWGKKTFYVTNTLLSIQFKSNYCCVQWLF